MPKETKFSWNDMFKLDTVKPDESTPTTDKEEVVDTSTDTSTEDQVIKTDAPVIEERDFNDSGASEEEESDENLDTKSVETKVSPFSTILPLIESGVLKYDENKDYDDSVDGIKALLDENLQAAKESWKNELTPDALKVVEHLQAGGSIRDLLEVEENEPDYERDVDIENADHQKYLVADWLATQGYEEAEIEAKLAKYEDAGLIEEEAKTAHKQLIKLQYKRREEVVAQQKRVAEENKLKIEKNREDFKSKVLGTKEIAGMQLKDGESQELYNYIMKPVKDGKSQMQLDYDQDSQLKMAYFMMKKFDFNKIQSKAATKATIKLKEVVNRTTDPQTTNKGAAVVPEDDGPKTTSTDIYGLPWQTSSKKKR